VALPITGPIAAVTVDAPRRRVFALGARSVAVIDADTGRLMATIHIPGTRCIALEPLGGHIFAATADGHISEIDPDRRSIVRTVDAGGPVDVLVYDAVLGRLFADGGARQSVAVFDTRSFVQVAGFPFAPQTPGSMRSDPITGDVLIATTAPEVAIVAPLDGGVRARFPTPGLTGRTVVTLDDALGFIGVTGTSGLFDVYDRAGLRRSETAVPAELRACDLDTASHALACTGPAGLTFVQIARTGAARVVGTVERTGSVFAAFDAKTNDLVAVGSNPDGTGTRFERFTAVEGRETHPIP
jgi:hypothetical protein